MRWCRCGVSLDVNVNVNERCMTCRDWVQGVCGGIDAEPGSCYVEPDGPGESWDDVTGDIFDGLAASQHDRPEVEVNP